MFYPGEDSQDSLDSQESVTDLSDPHATSWPKGKDINNRSELSGARGPKSVNDNANKRVDQVISALHVDVLTHNQSTKMDQRLFESVNALRKSREVLYCVNKIKQKEEIYRKDRKEKIEAQQREGVHKQAESNLPKEVPLPPEGETNQMDIKLVYEMFSKIRSDIAVNNIANGKERLENVELRQDELIDSMNEMKRELAQCKMQNSLLTNAVIHLTDKVKIATNKISKLELNSTKRSIVVTGFNLEPKKSICIRELKYFFKQVMYINIQIEDVFFLSREGTSPMVMTVSRMQDKNRIFSNLGKLKGLVNEEDKPYFFTNYLPSEINERRRKEDNMIKENLSLPEKDQIEMEKQQGKLYVKWRPYSPAIVPPAIQEILALKNEEVCDILDAPVKHGVPIKKENNTFIGYAASTNTLQEINRAYRKMRIIHTSTKHIVCAYMIPGAEKLLNEDSCDDGDTSAGRLLLNWMQQNKLNCRAIFVVRFENTDGKLGQDRFDCYIRAAASAINSNPLNNITGQDQSVPNSPVKQQRVERPRGVSYNKRGGQTRPTPSLSEQRGMLSRGEYNPRGRAKSIYYSKKRAEEGNSTYESEWPSLNENSNV